MKKVLKIISTSLIAIISLVLLFNIVIQLFGFKGNIVMSGSMEPNVHTGSIAYIKQIDQSELKENDIVTYLTSDNMSVTHRIISIDYENNTCVTKGDANVTSDGVIKLSQIKGKCFFTIPLLGYVIFYVKKYIVILIGVGIILLIINIAISTVKKSKSKEE